ncbi:hypothetical protein [Nonomuraea zeae]|uniref:Uncharacterized protein n=1 Tax=Nonomuraea zeae TaxID=1642303 RepID=A0A5S4G255_9ACTN|nr:hypothetical protein [Nonomuraea zeae]TMR27073.1 hypothetical protein ETD85_40315 [Nonomuraea zeae]
MADSSETDNPFGDISSLGTSMSPSSIDPNFKMRHSSVRTLGTNVAGYGQDLTQMSDKTRSIDMHTLTFGVIGGGLNVAHRSVRDNAADALKQGKEVLDSWKDALSTAADNTQQAEEAGKTGDEKGGGKTPSLPKTPGGLGNLGAGGLGGSPTGLGDLGGSKVDPSDLNLDKPSPGDLDPSDLDPSDIDTPDLDQPDLTQPDLTQPDLTQPDLTQPGATQPDLTTPDLSGVQQPNTSIPDLNGVNQPTGTNLAGVDPNLANTPIPQVRTPDATAYDPRTSVSVPRSSVGYPEGALGSTGSAGSGVGAPGSLARALNTGTPIYPPPMGGGAGGAGNEDKDRERGAHVPEEEGVWGMDEDYAPAVLGREE